LIVLAGTVALNNPLTSFCSGRTDAAHGNAYLNLTEKNFLDASIAKMRSETKLMGFTDDEIVVLSARLRSPALMEKNGYEGTWTTTPTALSNQYFTSLLGETWVNYTVTASGKWQYKAQGKNLYMLPYDLNLINDAAYKTVVQKYAADNTLFLADFAKAWIKLMNIDRYDGPTGNLCANVTAPTVTSTGTTGTTSGNVPPSGDSYTILVSLVLLFIALVI